MSYISFLFLFLILIMISSSSLELRKHILNIFKVHLYLRKLRLKYKDETKSTFEIYFQLACTWGSRYWNGKMDQQVQKQNLNVDLYFLFFQKMLFFPLIYLNYLSLSQQNHIEINLNATRPRTHPLSQSPHIRCHQTPSNSQSHISRPVSIITSQQRLVRRL